MRPPYITRYAVGLGLMVLLLGIEASGSPPPALTASLLDGDPVRARGVWEGLSDAEREALVPWGGRLAWARILRLEGQLDRAAAVYEEMSDGVWADVALNEWAAVLRSLSDPGEPAVLERLEQKATTHPDRDRWRLRRAGVLKRSGSHDEARRLLDAVEKQARSRQIRREAAARLVELDLREGGAGYAAAQARFRRLVNAADDDDAVLNAAQVLAAYEQARGISIEGAEARRRGNVFYQAREWDVALRNLAQATGMEGVAPDRFEGSFPESSGAAGPGAKSVSLQRAEDLYLIGRIYYRQGIYRSAAAAYDLVANHSPSDNLARSARFQKAVCLERAGEYEGALAELDLLIDGDPRSSVAMTAARRKAGLLRTLGRGDEAWKVVEGARGRTRDEETRKAFDWLEVAIFLETDPGRAGRVLQALAEQRGEDRHRARRILAELRRRSSPDEASALLRRVMADDPGGYHGEVARMRLVEWGEESKASIESDIASARQFMGAPASGDANPVAIGRDRLLELRRRSPSQFSRLGIEALRQAYALESRFGAGVGVLPLELAEVGPESPRFLRLLALGLGEEASFVLEGERRGARMEQAVAARLGRATRRSIYLAEVQANQLPSETVYEALDPGLLRLLYPLPQALIQVGRRLDIDPRLLAAVIREESRFDPEARSPAGARGLMQLVIDTARPLAEQTGVELSSPDDLYGAELSMELGARYLKKLLEEFDGSVPAVIAAYNAGPDAAQEWVARGGADLMHLEYEITYSETRTYLHKVYLSYLRYQGIYDDRGEERTWPWLLRP